MDVLLNFATGLKISQTTSEGKIVCTLLDQTMDTCGMMWIVLPVISTRVKKVHVLAIPSNKTPNKRPI